MKRKGIKFNRKKVSEFDTSEKEIEEESKAFYNSLDDKMKLEQDRMNTDGTSLFNDS